MNTQTGLEDLLRQLLDEREIVNVVNGIGMNADLRDWRAISDAFAGEVLFDYSSMGQPVATLKPADIVARWKALLPGFTATQHVITNHRVSVGGDEAECLSYATGAHHLPNDRGSDLWLVVGYYEHHLVREADGWKVDRMKFTSTMIFGNTDLPDLAAKAVKAATHDAD